MIRVGLIDSNELVRSGRAMILGSQPDFKLVLEESDPQRALDRAPDYLVDILIVSMNQHGYSGTNYISRLSKVLREAGNQAEILVTTPFFSKQLRWNSVLAGAADLLSLESNAKEFLQKLRAIAKGNYLVDAEFLEDSKAFELDKSPGREFDATLVGLDPTQRKLLSNFMAGLNDYENAKQLDIAKLRVTQLIRTLMESGGFQTRNQLAIALRESSA